MAMRVYKATWKDAKGKPGGGKIFRGNAPEEETDEEYEAEYARRHPKLSDVKLVRVGTDDRTPKDVIEQRPTT